VHRYEPSGALHGLLRVRGFTQDDAHISARRPAREECLKINDLILSVYADFGFTDDILIKSRPARKRVGTDAMWDHAEGVLRSVLDKIAARSATASRSAINRAKAHLWAEVRIRVRDAIGPTGNAHTQVDLHLPERFGAF